VSNKEIVRDLLEQLPSGASLHEIARKIEFVATGVGTPRGARQL
jgi:hypothetical protein